jgi:hypothetical protein
MNDERRDAKDEVDRRARAAAWDEMDKMPHPAVQFLHVVSSPGSPCNPARR